MRIGLKTKIRLLSLNKITIISLILSVLALLIMFLSIIYYFNNMDSLKRLKKLNKYKTIILEKPVSVDFDLVTCTVYNPTRNQGWGNGDILYDGTKIRKDVASGYRYVSVSKDLLKKYPVGSEIRVYCFEETDYYSGIWKVKDKMHASKRNHIDFLQADLKMKLKKNYCFIRRV